MIADNLRIAGWRRSVGRVIEIGRRLGTLDDAQIVRESHSLRWQAESGVPLHRLIPEAFALIREATRREIGMEHFPVQILGGIAMFNGGLAEMQTGEGKTITAALPTYLRALVGRGVHVVTVNDYLAQRDAELLAPVFRRVGLRVGCVTPELEDEPRREAYACDVTYGTASEFGFDFLRDRMRIGVEGNGAVAGQRPSSEKKVQQGHYCAVVDEADSVLIDDARTPLLIGMLKPNLPAHVSLFRWGANIARSLSHGEDYLYNPHDGSVQITKQGGRAILSAPKPRLADFVDLESIYEHVENALRALVAFSRDQHYVVDGGAVQIVDESTGRVMDGRKWQNGLHQAIEAKERLPVTSRTVDAARITVQSFFRKYEHVCGMTGTARSVQRELRKTYRLSVTAIPTHRPCLRKRLKTRVFRTTDAKTRAIIEEVEQMRRDGRPILIGTQSVERSEQLAKAFQAADIPCEVLNARHHAREANIIAGAGRARAVTIATNMAGRGTDIKLTDQVRAAGGLQVIATAMHSASRIDRQLVGRTARQGDPGSFRFFLSLEDDLLQSLPPRLRAKVQSRIDAGGCDELDKNWVSVFRAAQRRVERQEAGQRKSLLAREADFSNTYRQLGLDPYLEAFDDL